MSKPNPHSGEKRKRSSEHSGGDLDYREKPLIRRSPSSAEKLTVPLQPPTQLGVSTTVQEPNEASRVGTWVADSQEQLHVLDQTSALSDSTIDLDSQILSSSLGATSKTAPLTRQNLGLLRQQTMSGNREQDVNSSTPSVKTKTKSTSSVSERNIWNATRMLRINGMHIEDYSEMANYPSIKEEVDRLLVDRESEKKRDTEELAETFKQFGFRNEATLQANVMPLLRGQARSVTQQILDGEQSFVKQSWLKDQLGENWDFPFAADSLPVLEPGTIIERKVFEDILKKFPRLKNPKPDVLYGSWVKAFSKEEQAINEKFATFSSISQDLYHASFVWEWKSAKGNIEESTLQACRAAAAVGYAIREFQKCMGINPDNNNMIDGVDVKSLVYAICIDNRAALMYAGFYARDGDSVVFRFIPAKEYRYFMDAKPLSNLRQDVHNVLDWNVGERRNWIKCLIGEYIEREKAKFAAAAKSSTAGALNAANVGPSTAQAVCPSESYVNKRQRTGKEQSTQPDI